MGPLPTHVDGLRDALEHDAGASCRAIAALNRAPLQAMGTAMVGIGPRPERAWQVFDAGRGQGERQAHQ